MLGMIELFLKLMLVSAITDIALQTEWMHYVKCGINPRVAVEIPWYYGMGTHSMVNGAGVWLVTGNVYLGLVESVLHFGIDYLKCINATSTHLDVALHILCRVGYVLIFRYLGGI